MTRQLEARAGAGEIRISEPDDEGHRFIIAPCAGERAAARPSDETGPYAREGA